MIEDYKRPAKFTYLNMAAKRLLSFILYCGGLAGVIIGASHVPSSLQVLFLPVSIALIIWSSWYFSGTFFK